MGRKLWKIAILLTALGLAAEQMHALPLCIDKSVPQPMDSLGFCNYQAYEASSCCDKAKDEELAAKWTALNVTGQCGAVMKTVLCAQCDPYSAELYGLGSSTPRTSVPWLCTNASASASIQNSFCFDLWSVCRGHAIANNPFAAESTLLSANNSVDISAPTLLSSLYNSSKTFCAANGRKSGNPQFCYDGQPFELPPKEKTPDPGNLCLERIAKGAYLNMIPHPDGSNRVFLTTQSGVVLLTSIPKEGQGAINEKVTPFLNITGRVIQAPGGEMGLLGLAFHPDFMSNGQFYVSYNCDGTKFSDCNATCACNADAGCSLAGINDPTHTGSGIDYCRNASVIAQYSGLGVGPFPPTPAQVAQAQPDEVRRILTVNQPYHNHKGGQLLFGPEDKYLYTQLGDGGFGGDPWNFAQNKKAILGKMLRLNVDVTPSADEIKSKNLWGSYGIPADNPFANDSDARGEIFAYGLRNPWKCSFDRQRPDYFFCADVGQNEREEIDLIRKGGNYGWRVYEGTALFTPSWAPGPNFTAPNVNALQLPVLEYSHLYLQSIRNGSGGFSVIGGYLSRSGKDACLYGRYLYNDYSGPIFAATENPVDSGKFISKEIKARCSSRSPLKCKTRANSTAPDFGIAWAWGEDNNGDLYMLTQNGIYRVTSPSRCGYQCLQKFPPPPPPATVPSSPPLPASPPPEGSQGGVAGGRDEGSGKKTGLDALSQGQKAGLLMGGLAFICLLLICGTCCIGHMRYNRSPGEHGFITFAPVDSMEVSGASDNRSVSRQSSNASQRSQYEYSLKRIQHSGAP